MHSRECRRGNGTERETRGATQTQSKPPPCSRSRVGCVVVQRGDLCQGKCGAGAVRASHASAAAVRRTCTRCTPSPQQSRVPAVPPITRAGLCHHVSAHGNLRLPRAPPPRPKRKAPTTHYTRRRRFAGDGGRDDKTKTTSEPLPGEATALPPSPRPRAKEQRQKCAWVCRLAW